MRRSGLVATLAVVLFPLGQQAFAYDETAQTPLTTERRARDTWAAAEEAECNIVFLSPWWTLYDNANGAIWLDWNVLPGMTGNLSISLIPSGGGSASVPSGDGFAAIDILYSNLDPFPPGYALAPGPVGTYIIKASVTIGGQRCTNYAYIDALPPPTSAQLKANGPAVEPGGAYSLLFHQKFPLTVPNTILYYIVSPGSLQAIDVGGQLFWFWFGSTATVGSDFLGPASNPYSGTSITYPAHDQWESVSLTMINDNCPEPTENVVTYWIYAGDATWGTTNMAWALLGAPSYTFDILDDDAGKPLCPVTIPPSEE